MWTLAGKKKWMMVKKAAVISKSITLTTSMGVENTAPTRPAAKLALQKRKFYFKNQCLLISLSDEASKPCLSIAKKYFRDI